MNPGYVPAMQECYGRYTGNLLTIDNYSVGASTCVWGLEAAKSCDLNIFDAIIIEFGVTDPPFIKRTSLEFWAACYESLLLYIRKKRPDIAIAIPFLRGLAGVNLECDSDMRFTLARLSEKYKATVFDVYDHLRGIASKDGKQIEDYYADPAHYSRPSATDVIGEFLGLGLSRVLEARRVGLPETCSHHAPSYDLCNAKVLQAKDLLSLAGEISSREEKKFKNSAISRSSIAIYPEVPLDLKLSGQPISFTVISTIDSGTLKIEIDDQEPIFYNTLTVPVRDAGRPFLFRPLFALPSAWDKRDVSDTSVKISVLAKPVSPQGHKILHQPGLLANASTNSPVGYLSSVLVRGAEGL